ncbi:DUF6526 family protein [Rossellomorea aquimaris]|uniref:DUF6526 family protein n=1 Tax=Rossellomorea aquimaris TaxID=189382 RepID=UPI0007D073CE|nr:DUF6526 family protein [Rossellomorea aquimaris]
MNQQNYQHHRKIDPLFHGVIALLSLITLIFSIMFFVQNLGSQWLLSLVLLLTTVTLVFLALMVRGYALKLQDRIIRTEENFRYYRLTGKLLDSKLSLKQVIALRFADDEEFPELVAKAVSENLSPDDIKQAVQKWRADHHRV